MAQIPKLATGIPIPHVLQAKISSVARTDTAPKILGYVPKNGVVIGFSVWGAVASNAATTATVSVGKRVPFLSISSTTTTATVTTAAPHGLTTSDTIIVANTGVTNYNQATPVAVASVPTSTTFTYTISSTNGSSTVGDIYSTNFFVDTVDVKTAAGTVSITGAKARNYFQAQAMDYQLVMNYAESGTASTTGGPWFVEVRYVTLGPNEPVAS